MNIYAVFDGDGKATAFFNDEINSIIPDNAVSISDTDWHRYLSGGYHRDSQTGKCVEDPGPTGEQILQAARDAKCAQINAARDAAGNGGMQYGGYNWDSDEKSRVNLTGLLVSLQAGTPLPDGFTWRTADNIDVALTAAQFVEFGAAMLVHINAQYVKSWQLKALVETAATVANVEAIVWE